MATAPTSGATQADAAQLLYERYYSNVYRYALSQLRSPQDAEDAAQNTFLRAFTALQKGTVPENEAAWLFKIAHNVCASSKLAWLRRRRVEAPRDLAALPLEPSSPESRRDELTGLEDALAAMPPRLREAFLLREWQGLSYAEIAERLDTSRSAVETLIFRARRLLAQQLDQPLQRIGRALGVGPLVNVLRGLLEATPTAVKAAGAIAVAAGATAAVTPLVGSSGPAPTVPANVPAPPGAVSIPGQRAAHRPAVARVRSRPARASSGARSRPASAGTRGARTPAAAPLASASAGPVSAPGTSTPIPALELPSVETVTTMPATPSLPVTPPPATPALPSVPVPDVPAAPALPSPPTVTVPSTLP
jgi:RNA polymerase sigma-70 factor, ECF subfamily